jgi:quinol monooxygenase YgiN
MPIVRITSPREITWELYNQVAEKIDAGGPVDGLIVHTAVDNDGKPRFIDVWESNEHAERFGQERIGPAVAEIAPDIAGPPDPDQVEIHEVKHITRG